MPSGYGDRSQSSSARGYGARTGSPSGYGARGVDLRPKKSGGGSFLDKFGVAGNLIQDVGDTLEGLPGGWIMTGKAAGLDLADLVTHRDVTPERLGKLGSAIKDSYAYTYGPFVHGDWREFGRRVWDHPLQPLLDAATVVTLGAGAGVKASVLPALAARQLEFRSPAALAGDPAGAVAKGRALSRNPVIRGRQLAVDAGLKKLKPETPVLGEFARYARALRHDADAKRVGYVSALQEYTRALGSLSRRERVALDALARVPLPAHYDSWTGMLREAHGRGEHDAGELADLLDDPRVRKLYDEPTDRMLEARDSMEKLGKLQARLLGERGQLPADVADAARYRHSRLAAGAAAVNEADAGRTTRQLDRELSKLARDYAHVDEQVRRLRGRGTPDVRAAETTAARAAAAQARAETIRQQLRPLEQKADQLRSSLTQTRERLARLASGDELTSQDLLDGGLRPGSDFEGVRIRLLGRTYDQAARLAGQLERTLVQLARAQRRLEHIGEATPEERAAHAGALAEARRDLATRLAAGRAELSRLDQLQAELRGRRDQSGAGIVGGPTIEQIREQLAAAGRPNPVYLPDVDLSRRRDGAGGRRGATATPRQATHASEGVLFMMGRLAMGVDVLGPDFLRAVQFAYFHDLHDALLDAAVRVPYRKGDRAAPPDGHVWVSRPASIRGGAAKLGELIRDEHDIAGSELARRGLTTRDAGDAYIGEGSRWAVPERMARTLEVEYRKASTTVKWLFEKPTEVWRALVLHLRVGWLVNNVIGNTLLSFLGSGPAGLRSYLDAVRNARGPRWANRLLRDPKTVDALDAADIAELLPAQAPAGTFMGSQLPTGRTPARLRTLAATRPARATLAVGTSLARADKAYESTLRRGAANAALRRSPEVKARLKAMPIEARSFRAAARQELESNPALAREISDKVDRTLGSFLGMSQFERRYIRAAVPFYSWLRAITIVVAKLPLETPGRAELIRILGELGHDTSREELGPLPSFLQGAVPLHGNRILNPAGMNPLATVPQIGRAAGGFLGAGNQEALTGELNPFLQASGQYLFGGEQGRRALPLDVASTIGSNLPQVRLGQALIQGPPDSKLYENSALDELMRFLGVPLRTINPRRAHELAREGR